MKRRLLLRLIFLSSFATVLADASNHLSIEELQQVRFPEVTLESVKHVSTGAKPHVEVKGIIGEHIQFELLLPDQWNERFVMGGGGGFVGTVQNMARFSVNLGYATVGTDTGHQFPQGHIATWAYNDIEAKVNFGYLAVHRTAEVSKALIRTYYRKEPMHSYFVGCSRGGGQALMEAQRFPNDFDGVVSGAPAFNWTGLAAMAVSIAKALYPDSAHLDTNVLSKDALQKLATGIIEQCDAQDGLKDGVIQDPASVHFDLSKIEGLTEDQRKAIDAIFQGARNVKGAAYPGFAPVAECDPNQWTLWITGPVPGFTKDQAADLLFAFGTQIFKYLIFNDPNWDYSKYDFSTFEHDTQLAASYLNANNPNLSGLKKRDGKLIIWHGWADTALPAQATIEYYMQVKAHDPSAADYCRLFLVPGCLHCGGGPGATDIDWLSAIVDWVEKGRAPDKLIAAKKENGKTVMTRPIYPYPETAIYKGSGDPNSSDSFEAKR